MLAKFENGYYLEVYEEIDKEDINESIYSYHVYDEEFDMVDRGWTEYRSMDMYYPMNLIDYILEYCEPDELDGQKGKYEILDIETMEEHEKYFKDFFSVEYGEHPNGEWALERQGTDHDDIRYYKSKEAAKMVMMKETEEYEDYENQDINDEYCEISDEEFYQSWAIYKREHFDNKKDELLYEIEMEIGRADTGITQYVYELQDTSVARDHLEKITRLINELKEVI